MGPKTVRVRNLEAGRTGAQKWREVEPCDRLTQHTGCIACPWPGLEGMHLSLGHVIEGAFAALLLHGHKK